MKKSAKLYTGWFLISKIKASPCFDLKMKPLWREKKCDNLYRIFLIKSNKCKSCFTLKKWNHSDEKRETLYRVIPNQ